MQFPEFWQGAAVKSLDTHQSIFLKVDKYEFCKIETWEVEMDQLVFPEIKFIKTGSRNLADTLSPLQRVIDNCKILKILQVEITELEHPKLVLLEGDITQIVELAEHLQTFDMLSVFWISECNTDVKSHEFGQFGLVPVLEVKSAHAAHWYLLDFWEVGWVKAL